MTFTSHRTATLAGVRPGMLTGPAHDTPCHSHVHEHTRVQDPIAGVLPGQGNAQSALHEQRCTWEPMGPNQLT